jgi:hypothetical protein
MGKIQRTDAKINASLIKKRAIELFEQNGSMPLQSQVAKDLNLSRQTVAKYWASMSQDFSKMVAPYRILTPKVIEATFKSATDLENGSSADRKLWLQVVEGRMGGDDVNSTDGITINIMAASDSTTNIQVNKD